MRSDKSLLDRVPLEPPHPDFLSRRSLVSRPPMTLWTRCPMRMSFAPLTREAPASSLKAAEGELVCASNSDANWSSVSISGRTKAAQRPETT